MKKLIVALLTCLSVVALADETYTNQMGQVFTVSSSSGITSDADALAAVTYDLDTVAAVTVASDDASDTITAYTTYLTGSAAAATNVTFAAPYPAGKTFTLINVGTATVTIATSATFDIGASALALGQSDAVTMHAVNTGLAYRVSSSDN